MSVKTYQYGDDKVAYVILQDTFATAKKPLAANAVRVISGVFGQETNFQEAMDRRKTRSVMETVKGRTPVQPWSLTTLFRPSGSLGVAPQIGDLLKLAMGTETVTASTSVAYTLLKDPTNLFASIYGDISSIFEGVYDAIVQTVNFAWNGDDFIRVTFSGIGSNYIEAGRNTANGTGSAVAALIVDNPYRFTKFAILQNETQSDDNGGAGYQVTADPNFSTSTLTLEATASWDDEDVWAPFLPTANYGTEDEPIFGTLGSLSFGGSFTDVGYTDVNITLNTGLDLLNREGGTVQASDVVMTPKRGVEGTIGMLVKEDETDLDGFAREKSNQTMIATVGDTAGSRVKFRSAASKMELRPGQRTSPETGLVERTLGFQLKGSSGEDEFDILLD